MSKELCGPRTPKLRLPGNTGDLSKGTGWPTRGGHRKGDPERAGRGRAHGARAPLEAVPSGVAAQPDPRNQTEHKIQSRSG